MITKNKIPKGFERLEKGVNYVKLPHRSISINGATGRITFSRDLSNSALKDFYGVEVFINRKDKIIFFIPSNDKVESYKINKPKQYKSKSICSISFKNENIKSGTYPVRYNLGKIELRYTTSDVSIRKGE